MRRGVVLVAWPRCRLMSMSRWRGESRQGGEAKRKHRRLKDRRRLGAEPASTPGPKEKAQDPRPKTQDPRAGAQRHGSSVALANVARERAAHADEKKDGAPKSRLRC
ncbi:uncharacterized protein TrAtP1_005447 [Trichoderma atroviride]|uniref:uncharacterized protein n=1 Tax=Hypocrea atroviridis TaxID=63577 RepID=UPI0033258AF1|nr:hypothetical protein TrAtP1_005447 [Trichoderma atroviride]